VRGEPDDRSRSEVPRARSGALGRRSSRTGTEPVTARSALGLRLLLAGLFLPLFAAAAVLLAVRAAQPGSGGAGPATALAVLCGVLAVTAAVDLVVVVRRPRRERGTGR